jgi:hypothetical protein
MRSNLLDVGNLIRSCMCDSRQMMRKTTISILTCICYPTTKSSSSRTKIHYSTTGKPTRWRRISQSFREDPETIHQLEAQRCYHCPDSTGGGMRRFWSAEERHTVLSSTREQHFPQLNPAEELHLCLRIQDGH